MECSLTIALEIAILLGFRFFWKQILVCLGVHRVLRRLWWWWDGVWEEDLEARDVVMREEGARDRWVRAVWTFLVRAWEAVVEVVVGFWRWVARSWERSGG